MRIADRGALETFRREWTFHHPLEPAQLEHAGSPAIVRRVIYYHGGDVLYELDGIHGMWHEACLRKA